MSDAIVIETVSKSFGRKKALQGLSLRIPQGMFGLLGRNGAGKTTLMRTIATLLAKEEGTLTVCGVPVERAREVRKLIGYLPQDFNMYPSMSVYDAMDYLGVLSGLDGLTRRLRIPLLLEQVNLANQRRTKVHALSGGMKRRLGIAQALLHDPKVLIVDEPTAGLDPEERVRFRNLLSEVAQDKTVLLSTHIVGDIEAACQNIAILDQGQLLYGGTVSGLLERAQGAVYSATVGQGELEVLKDRYLVTGMLAQGVECIVRFLSPGHTPEFGEPIAPCVEDAYLLCLHQSWVKPGADFAE